MAHASRARLEAVLRGRKLDGTLTTSLSSLDGLDASARAATGVRGLDEALQGGLRRGHVSEVVGAHSSGRTTVLLSLLAAATRRGEIVALIDAHDRLDVASAMAAGVDLDRVLWVRGEVTSRAGATGGGGAAVGAGGEAALERTVGRAVKAMNLVLQAGGFGVVAIDLADVPAGDLTRMPPTTWLRLQRAVEDRDTVCVLVAPQPLGRSAGGVTLTLEGGGAACWTGTSDRSRLLVGTEIRGRVVSPRRGAHGAFAVMSTVPGLVAAVTVGAEVEEADMEKADMEKTDMEKTDMEKTDMEKTNVRRALRG